MQFFQAFGIDWKGLIAQFVNFGVLLFVLYLIGYGPLLRFMKERKTKIEQGLADAEKAKSSLEDARVEESSILVAARKEAMSIIEDANARAKNQSASMIAKAKQDVEQIVNEGKSAIELERKRMLQQVKGDVVDMVALSTKKVLGKAVNEEIDQKWLKSKLASK